MSTAPSPNHGGTVAPQTHIQLGRSSSMLDPAIHPPLPIVQVGAANRAAQLRGIAFGLCGGVLSAFISRKALNLSRNASYLSGLLAGTGVAYITARQQLERNLGAVEAGEKGLRNALAGKNEVRLGQGDEVKATDQEMLKYDLIAGGKDAYEAGVGGMHELSDRYASSRGDH